MLVSVPGAGAPSYRRPCGVPSTTSTAGTRSNRPSAPSGSPRTTGTGIPQRGPIPAPFGSSTRRLSDRRFRRGRGPPGHDRPHRRPSRPPGRRCSIAGTREADDRPYACAINAEEIQRGLRGEEEANAASRLFDGLGMVWLGRDEGDRAGTWRRAWAAQGVTLSQADCLIAAAALSIGGRLATGNPADFPMNGLQVEHWPVGE